jgi:hypothetical protein
VTAWNLAVFSGHHPRHPQYLKEKGIERISTTFLILEFSSAEKRQNFNENLTKEIGQRDIAADIDSRAGRRVNTFSQNPSFLRTAPGYAPPEGHSSFSSNETAGSPDAGSTSSAPEIDAMSFSPGFTPSIVFDRNVSGTRLRPRLRVPESWRGPGHNKLYGAGPVGSHLIKLNYEALCISPPRCRDN